MNPTRPIGRPGPLRRSGSLVRKSALIDKAPPVRRRGFFVDGPCSIVSRVCSLHCECCDQMACAHGSACGACSRFAREYGFRRVSLHPLSLLPCRAPREWIYIGFQMTGLAVGNSASGRQRRFAALESGHPPELQRRTSASDVELSSTTKVTKVSFGRPPTFDFECDHLQSD